MLSALSAAAAIAPGVYADMPMDDYHAAPGISSSGLKLIGRSPAHYMAERNKPASRALKVGSALHAMRQHQAEFDRLFIARPEGLDGRTKDGKAQLAELRQSGRRVLTAAEYESVKGMVASLTAHSRVMRIMQGAVLESSIFWRDDETGELCKCRPDVYRQNLGLILDYKSCEDSRPEAARRQILRFGYHISAAMYLDGTGANNFLFAFVERDPPHPVGLYNASPEMIAAGHALYREYIQIYARCRATNEWPGYPQEVIDIFP